MAAQRVPAGMTGYEGPACAQIRDDDRAVRVRLTGHLDPIDGRYHWRGTVYGIDAGLRLPHPVRIAVGERVADGRLTELTPWGTHTVAGVGAPPFEV
ncbi:monooxygenase [Mycolicibacterium phlei DSM 43072]|uniref:Monooxygenase n=2 Tax=Mycolicibacterium phlei TaxID=1771 RepID=A0A5N5UVE0_MYCPH|nr:hypothetical protein MPHLEI_20949 [Mycolicibacterium phlei RIVM601174]KAB7753553.1 monooxygenase [Mycolicibacterium phlei DSM 43239 = CCUG 21000]KXW69864.1 monooxygenase [Mycolicibacterium phlei DSM 43072]KXW70414.1 monooxygenase [Mycolicibacterium phlei DSM 43070]KXW76016.1 hypothetical protein JL15_19285 [Mycolicibacterium phlei DSM 43071]MBF4194023.1 hypothetical protein [Mycolicibacterium phlei]